MPFDTVRPSLSNPVPGLLLTAAFLASMVMFFTHYDPYRDVGANVVQGGDFEVSPLPAPGSAAKGPWRGRGPGVEWQAQGGFEGSGGVRLGVHSGRGSNLRFRGQDAEEAPFVRLSARLRADDIVPGRNSWNTGQILLLFTDHQGRSAYREGCELTGSAPWRRCERVIEVPKGTATVQIIARNLAASGTLWVDDLKLSPAEEKPSTPFWRVLFSTLWCAVIVYCAWISRVLDRPGLAVIGIAIVIVAGVTAPQPLIEKVVHRGADAAHGLSLSEPLHADPVAGPSPASSASKARPPTWSAGWPFDLVFTVKKVGHFVLFALLAFVTFSAVARRRHTEGGPHELAITGAALLLFAAAAEVVQYLTTSRSASVMDWGIDAAGVVLGGGFALILSRPRTGGPLKRPRPS
jgi:hypothetical protein